MKQLEKRKLAFQFVLCEIQGCYEFVVVTLDPVPLANTCLGQPFYPSFPAIVAVRHFTVIVDYSDRAFGLRFQLSLSVSPKASSERILLNVK